MDKAQTPIEGEAGSGWLGRRYLHLIAGLFFFVLSAVYIYTAFKIRVPPVGDPLGPRLFPLVLGSLLMLFTALFLAGVVCREKGEDDARDLKAQRSAWIVWALLALYALLFTLTGYLIATAIFVFVMLSFTKFRRLPVNVIAALIMAGAFYVIFKIWLGVPLPTVLF